MKLAIDPGHGMGNNRAGVYDPGACRAGYQEADIALAFANTLAWYCHLYSVPFAMTRRNNLDSTRVDLRADRAAASGCTHFVSLHLDSWFTPWANGLTTLWRTPQSFDLAQRLQARLVTATGRRNRGVKQRHNLAVLTFAPGPSALVELGFISNAADRTLLLQRSCRIVVARTILTELGVTLRDE